MILNLSVLQSFYLCLEQITQDEKCSTRFASRQMLLPIRQVRDSLRSVNLSAEVAIELHPLHLPEPRAYWKVA